MSRTVVCTFLFFCLLQIDSPAGSGVQFPSGDSVWVADIQIAGTAPGEGEQVPQKRPSRIRCTTTGSIRKYEITWSPQGYSEVWVYLGHTMVEDAETGAISHDSASLIPGYIIRMDASIFAWIGKETPFQETELDGRKCFLFEAAPEPGELGPGNLSDDFYKRLAWIDPETRLPLAYNNSVATYRFTFQSAPAEPLTLPARFAKAFELVRASVTQPPAWSRARK